MNKKQKIERCKHILHNYPLVTPIDNVDDFDFLLNIFENHTEWDIKKGLGIKFITIILTEWKTKCFKLFRLDGSSTDISYTHCIYNPSKLYDIKKACRSAVKDEIFRFRSENVIYGVSTCPFTEVTLTRNNTHIDHYDLTFDEMFKLWIADKDQEKLSSCVNETKDNDYLTYFTNDVIKDDFVSFHNKNSKLRAVSRIANLSLLK